LLEKYWKKKMELLLKFDIINVVVIDLSPPGQ
jgi:hypothetical protein